MLLLASSRPLSRPQAGLPRVRDMQLVPPRPRRRVVQPDRHLIDTALTAHQPLPANRAVRVPTSSRGPHVPPLAILATSLSHGSTLDLKQLRHLVEVCPQGDGLGGSSPDVPFLLGGGLALRRVDDLLAQPGAPVVDSLSLSTRQHDCLLPRRQAPRCSAGTTMPGEHCLRTTGARCVVGVHRRT